MVAQPLSREDSPAIFYPEPSPDGVLNTAKASTVKASTAKTSTSKTSASKAKTSTSKTPRKTVAKTATRRRTATKSVPIVDFPTPDNVQSLPVQYFTRLATPSLIPSLTTSLTSNASASDSLRSQLAACHQVLTALQAESQELQQTMASLISIASEMETLKPTHGTLTALTTRKSTKRKAAKSVSQPEPATQTSSSLKARTSKTTATLMAEPIGSTVKDVSSHAVNYWGTSAHLAAQPAAQPTAKSPREIQLPNLTPLAQPPGTGIATSTSDAATAAIAPETKLTKPSFHSSSLHPQPHTKSLTRQTVEYYVGHPAIPLEAAKPSFKSQSQRAAKPVSQFVAKPIAQPAIRTISRKIVRSAARPSSAQSVKFTAKPIATSLFPQKTVVQAQAPQRPQAQRPQQIKLITNRDRYTYLYLYQTIQQQLQSLIPIPKGESAILFDALCWTLSAIGLRMSCQMLINLLPLLTLPLNLALLFPALLATYLAFCIPKSSSAAVYRCLLMTLGFFISGKL